MKLKIYNWFMVAGLIACIGNIITSIILKNYIAAVGWFVASVWFPYEKVFGFQNRGEEVRTFNGR